jgi:hypothetical protein
MNKYILVKQKNWFFLLKTVFNSYNLALRATFFKPSLLCFCFPRSIIIGEKNEQANRRFFRIYNCIRFM